MLQPLHGRGGPSPPRPSQTFYPLTPLQVGASFFSRKGMVICSRASLKNFFRTVLLS